MTFTVLHVCLGNICRSPMAERLLAARFAERLAMVDPTVDPATLLHSASAGTGDWHVGEEMSQGAVKQLALRGISATGFRARSLWQVKLTESDLILTATRKQQQEIDNREPEVARHTYSLLQFGRLAREVAPGLLSAMHGAPTPSTVWRRGEALIAAVSELSAPTTQRQPTTDDLTDPYGRSEEVFSKVAEEIDHALAPLVATLVGDRTPPSEPQ